MSYDSSFDWVLMAIWNGWWQGIVLTAVVWLVMRDMPRLGAATRLAIWQMTMLVVVALPLLQRVPVWMKGAQQRVVQLPAAAPAAESVVVPVLPQPGSAVAAPTLPQARAVVEIQNAEIAEIALAAAGMLAMLQVLRLVVGYWFLRRWKRKSFPSGYGVPEWLSRRAEVRISDLVGMPISIGFWHPMILLPRAIATQLPAIDVEQIILHEAGHLERRDDWFGLAERLWRAVFFFQPAVAFIGREIDREREMACDDWVLAHNSEAKTYARALTRVAEMSQAERAPLLATGAGRRKEIFRRIEAILDGARERTPRLSISMLGVAACGLAVLVSQSAPLNALLGIRRYEHRMVSHSETRRLEIASNGEFRFASGNRDIERMQAGARFYLQLEEEGRKQRIEIEADGQGRIQRSYYADGMYQRFGAEAQRLLAKEVTPWVMSRGENIPDTLQWLLAERGFDGTLREIRQVPSDEAQRRYLTALLEREKADAVRAGRIWRAAQALSSDEQKKSFYWEASRLTPQVDASALVTAIQSEEVKTELLSEFVGRGQALRALDLARSLQAEERKAEILQKAWDWGEGQAAASGVVVEPAFRLLSSFHSEEAQSEFWHRVVGSKVPLGLTRKALLESLDGWRAEERQVQGLLAMLARKDLDRGMVDEVARRALRLRNEEARREIQVAIDKYGVSGKG